MTNNPFLKASWKMPFYPLPCILQLVVFLGIFITTESTLLYGSDEPILELSVLFLVIGALVKLANDNEHVQDAMEKGRVYVKSLVSGAKGQQ